MMQNHNLAKSIGDVAWNMLVTLTSYKAASAGSMVVLVDPRNTSKMCSRCGILVQKDLSERVHNCTQCGLSIDGDWNAAITTYTDWDYNLSVFNPSKPVPFRGGRSHDY
jgi:putative transposase